LPYVIAVDALGDDARERHAMQALFGTEGIEMRRDADGVMQYLEINNKDGLWMARAGAEYTRVNCE